MKKHILCIGDSNTHGYNADPADSEDHGIRFTENERWTCLLQKSLGKEYLVSEEGLSGRTIVFPDPLHESMDALSVIYSLLKSHEPIDLLILMLGTNDTKERLGMNAACISLGMQRLVNKAKATDCWGSHGPNILIICPPPIDRRMSDAAMGQGCAEKSEQLADYYEEQAKLTGCHFFNAKNIPLNQIDYMHFTRCGHAQLAEILTDLIPALL